MFDAAFDLPRPFEQHIPYPKTLVQILSESDSSVTRHLNADADYGHGTGQATQPYSGYSERSRLDGKLPPTDLLKFAQHTYYTKVLYYGVSSGGVLAAELSRCTRAGDSLPASIPRAELIRNLSVLVSYLEWVTRPGDGNHAACSEASRLLARILDDALDPQVGLSNSNGPQLLSESATNHNVPDGVQNGEVPVFNTNEALPLDSEAFLDWFDSIDWNNTMGF